MLDVLLLVASSPTTGNSTTSRNGNLSVGLKFGVCIQPRREFHVSDVTFRDVDVNLNFAHAEFKVHDEDGRRTVESRGVIEV